MNIYLKAILIIIGAIILSFIGLVIFVGIAFGSFDEDYSVTELKENFEFKKKEIYELETFFDSNIKDSIEVHIEFDDEENLGIFHVKKRNNYSSNKRNNYSSNWNLKINSFKVDSLLEEIGWDKSTLKTLGEKLEKANCISISNEEYTEIGFQRSGMGMYFFDIFDNPIPDTLKNKYSDSCTYILYNDSVVFEYGGGAIGPHCFYNFK